jgi:molecular chaperone DnaK (HSP70)
MKMAIVKHGASAAVDVVLNEQTHRKTVSYIGFRGDERYFGEDAFNLHTRFPTGMVTALTHWIGRSLGDADAAQADLLFRYNFTATERDTVSVRVGPEAAYSAEELLAMFLSYAKEMASNHAELPITDCVIAVPAAFTVRQRQAVALAAEIAGLHVFSLLPHSLAAALQYAVSRRGIAGPTTLLIFDMGAVKLEVGVFVLRPPATESKDLLGSIEVLAMESADIGGRHFDALLARSIAAEFHKTSGKDVLATADIEAAKAAAKLMRTGKKVKETLSANKDAPATVEGIHEERDFHTVVTREQFETLAAPLVARALAVVDRALANAGRTPADVDVCELMGGGTRVPVLQDLLVEKMKKPLSRTLNTDEAIAMAAAFQAAKESGLFRVKAFAITGHSFANVSFALSPDATVPHPAVRPLFPAGDNSTAKAITTFRSKADFNFTVYHSSPNGTHAPIDTVVLHNVSQAFTKMGLFDPNVHPNSTHRLETRFDLTGLGLVRCDGATARFDKVVNTTKRVKKAAPKAEDGAANQTAAAAEAEEEESPEEATPKFAAQAEEEGAAETTQDPKAKEEEGAAADADGGEANTTATSATVNTTTNVTDAVYETVNTTATVRLSERIVVTVVPVARPWPMGPKEMAAAKATLRRLQERDDAKRRVARAKNDLETTIYSTKYDKFFDVEELKPFYTEAEGTAILDVLARIEEWLEGDGYDATAAQYQAKLAEITKLTDAVWLKKEDAEGHKKPKEKAKESKDTKKATPKKAQKPKKKDDDSKDDADDDTKTDEL